jgi:O-antigen ligase
LLAPALAVLLVPVRKALKWVAAAAFGIGCVGLVLTGSRGGWLSLGVSAAVLAAVALRRGWVRAPQLLAATAVLTLALLPFVGFATERVVHGDGGSARSRVPLNRLAFELIRDEPLTGVGVNNVGSEMERAAGPEYSEEWVYTVHNKYLLVTAEAGVAALLAFVWFLASTLRRGRRAGLMGHPLIAPLAAGLTAALVGQLVHMTVEVFQSRPQVQLLWVAAALLTAMKEMPCLER